LEKEKNQILLKRQQLPEIQKELPAGSIAAPASKGVNNIGNIKNSAGVIENKSTPQEGWTDLVNYVRRSISGQHQAFNSKAKEEGKSPADLSLTEWAEVYSPWGDGMNNPIQKAKTMASILGVPVDTKVGDLEGRIPEFAKAVAKTEGNPAYKQVFPND